MLKIHLKNSIEYFQTTNKRRILSFRHVNLYKKLIYKIRDLIKTYIEEFDWDVKLLRNEMVLLGACLVMAKLNLL